MRIRFTPTARLQFLAAVEYIRGEKPSAAARFRKRVEKSVRRLSRYPSSGRVLPEFPELPYRELIATTYRFFYRIDGKTVWIVAVWHGAQLPDAPNV